MSANDLLYRGSVKRNSLTTVDRSVLGHNLCVRERHINIDTVLTLYSFASPMGKPSSIVYLCPAARRIAAVLVGELVTHMRFARPGDIGLILNNAETAKHRVTGCARALSCSRPLQGVSGAKRRIGHVTLYLACLLFRLISRTVIKFYFNGIFTGIVFGLK